MPARRRRGKMELATARTVREVPQDAPGRDALAALALHFARLIDEDRGDPAALGRELRQAVQLLTRGGTDEQHQRAAALFGELSRPGFN